MGQRNVSKELLNVHDMIKYEPDVSIDVERRVEAGATRMLLDSTVGGSSSPWRFAGDEGERVS